MHTLQVLGAFPLPKGLEFPPDLHVPRLPNMHTLQVSGAFPLPKGLEFPPGVDFITQVGKGLGVWGRVWGCSPSREGVRGLGQGLGRRLHSPSRKGVRGLGQGLGRRLDSPSRVFSVLGRRLH